MNLYISHRFFEYEAGNLFRLFFPYEPLNLCMEDGPDVTARAAVQGKTVSFSALLGESAFHREKQIGNAENKDEAEYALVSMMFQVFEAYTGYTPKWGMLTGIHPVKLFAKKAEALGIIQAERLFSADYFVSAEKIGLCKRILRAQEPAIRGITEQDFSLYISIPFCPSRCSYCSFVSQSVEKAKKLIAPYLALLMKELKHTAGIVHKTGLVLKSVYIGGGTPTTLTAEQLAQLLCAVREQFDMSACTEFTVEAGRPDTIDGEKLRVIKEYGVDRISINPQSLQDAVLQNIGRRHTAADVVNTYNLARTLHHQTINMDLIAGLQGDTAESFADTLEKVIALGPENVTVHTLALKRSANIFRSGDLSAYHSNKEQVEQMVAYTAKRLSEEGYNPYYLYRQSRMAGNLENTGWAKTGTVCAYNIYTMDESQTVIACGAGGVSKIIDPYSDRLERIFNFKYAHEYISRFEEILERKEEVTQLYEQFRKRIHQIHQPSGTDQ